MPDGSQRPVDRVTRIAAVQSRLARYIQVGEEINAELSALGLDALICNGTKRVRGQHEAIAGGLGYQPRARVLALALAGVQS